MTRWKRLYVSGPGVSIPVAGATKARDAASNVAGLPPKDLSPRLPIPANIAIDCQVSPLWFGSRLAIDWRARRMFFRPLARNGRSGHGRGAEAAYGPDALVFNRFGRRQGRNRRASLLRSRNRISVKPNAIMNNNRIHKLFFLHSRENIHGIRKSNGHRVMINESETGFKYFYMKQLA